MGRIFLAVLLCSCLFVSCDIKKREKELETKQLSLQQKEQELILREQALELKEEEFRKQDSIKMVKDTLWGTYPNLPGTWFVKMVCTETTCSGSAVGDTKTENWEISIQNNMVMAGAVDNGKLNRIYSGGFYNDRLEITSENTDLETRQNIKIVVRLKQTREGNMKGTREIIRQDDCHIVYDLELRKQK